MLPDVLERVQDGSKTLQDALERVQDCSKTLQDSKNTLSRAYRTDSKGDAETSHAKP